MKFALLLLNLVICLKADWPDGAKPYSRVLSAPDPPRNKSINYHTTLKVAIFPYLPDACGDNFLRFREYIRREFELYYPGVDLRLRKFNSSDGFYKVSTIKEWLLTQEEDVVEIDTLLLGDLVNAGVIAPFDQHVSSDWHSAAAAAVQFNQAVYAIPHWLCAYFLFTHDPYVAQSKTIDELVERLGPGVFRRLVGNLDASWDLPALYMDTYQDQTYSPLYSLQAQALHGPLSSLIVECLRKMAALCTQRFPLGNWCVDGTFDKPENFDLPAEMFARGEAAAMWGYSERLFTVYKNWPITQLEVPLLVPLPSGTVNNNPTFFTDAFVMRRNLTHNVRKAAHVFTEFMATPRMQAALAGSLDCGPQAQTFRYLLPISKAAYNTWPLYGSTQYNEFSKLIGVPLPNIGLPEMRNAMKAAILTGIK